MVTVKKKPLKIVPKVKDNNTHRENTEMFKSVTTKKWMNALLKLQRQIETALVHDRLASDMTNILKKKGIL